ncbi:MAG: ATP-binding protein [Chloroflexi bacterium]|nr:ATP-binding protein [Chloroflexota bacterium]
MLGRDLNTQKNVYLDASGSRAVLVCGKRGSGKSYTLGVLIEELVAVGGRNVIPIVVDPMGIYHTMVKRNERQSSELFRWGLTAQGLRVRLLIPGIPEELYDPDILDELRRRGVEYTCLRLNPADLTPDGWCDLFDADVNKPMGIVLFRAVQNLSEEQGFFTVHDIARSVEKDKRAQDTSKEALLNRLEGAARWHLFSEESYQPLDSIFEPGVVNVIDVSRLESGPQGRRNLIVSVVGRNLFRARSDARLREEFGLAAELPRVWLALDEAHQFAPSSGNSLGKQQLIRWAKEGRQPGLSLVVATQQPSAIDREILSQCDVILSHKLTTRDDVMALNSLSQDYMGSELRNYITGLERVGQAVLVDDERESVSVMQIRPRQSQHGGGTVASDAQNDYDIWQQ